MSSIFNLLLKNEVAGLALSVELLKLSITKVFGSWHRSLALSAPFYSLAVIRNRKLDDGVFCCVSGPRDHAG